MLAALFIVGSTFAQTPVEGSGGAVGPATDERQGGPFGLGVAVGAPSGIAGRLWLGDWSAVQFSAGGDLGRFNAVAITADYVLVFRPFEITDSIYAVPIYVGGGVNIDADAVAGGALLVGPRAVFGASLMVPELPLDLYAELTPTVYLLERFGWSIDGQLGVHYYF